MEKTSEIKIFAPVLIPTLCRFDHFKRCVESLSKCTHANKTELVIGVDYPAKEEHWVGYKKIDAYVDTIVGFKKVTVLRTNHNLGLGPNGNLARLFKYIDGKYDRWISTEDDNEFAPAFLDFMNKALELYKDDSQVNSVCGFNQYKTINQKIVFTYDSSAWGFGRWSNKPIPSADIVAKTLQSSKKMIKVMRFFPASLLTMVNMVRKNKSYGDARWTCDNIINERFQIRPAVSLVKNSGLDGSGAHGGKNNRFIDMQLYEGLIYDFSWEEPKRTKEIDKQVRRNMMPHSFFNRMKTYFKIIIYSLKLKIRGHQ